MRLSRTDALTLLREALATLPSELDARAEFFVQWRARTIQSLELIFADNPAPAAAFKEIEFSPRRLTKDETRDAQLKLDAFLSGCVTARAQMEELVRHLLAEPEAPTPEPMPQVEAAPQQPSIAEAAAPQLPVPEVPVVQLSSVEAVPPQPAHLAATPQLPAEPVIKGAHMSSHELCAPVRSSLSRVLGAWERGDRDAALVLSAQLLADLTVLSRDDHFKSAFDGVVSKFVGRDGLSKGLDSLQSAAPLCVWSMMAAMNEVMKARV
ncbi:MAG TPA: hypothetical protein VG269_29605 [Tepidisphaeraceae bacterium]|nr:hypothetical protein [Tepidisphaeraceae bacterium]